MIKLTSIRLTILIFLIQMNYCMYFCLFSDFSQCVVCLSMLLSFIRLKKSQTANTNNVDYEFNPDGENASYMSYVQSTHLQKEANTHM